jgi:hypothetical protein
MAAFHVTSADVVAPVEAPLPKLQTYEELGITDVFQKAVQDELTKDEKILWLGRPTKEAAVRPPLKALMVIGIGLLVFAAALPVLFHGMPFIFPIALALFGILFLVMPKFMNAATGYQACYVVTNRRALLFERGMLGFDPQKVSLSNILGTRCRSYLPHELVGMERRNNPQAPGAGDLIFEYIFTIGQGALLNPGTTGTIQRTDVPNRTPRGFFFLDNVDGVERLIRTALLANLET